MISRVAAKVRRGVARRLRARGAVLLYHRVASGAKPDSWGLRVTPEHFRAHAEMLAAQFNVVPLDELASAARVGRLPPKAVAISFDDGYVDNLLGALPELVRSGLPATLFVATGFIGSGEPFWWDELEALGRADLQPRFRRMPLESVVPMLALARTARGLDGPADTGNARPMTHDELARLAASDLMTIGAHTRSHASLAVLDRATVRAELVGSRADLADWLGAPPPALFSYPFGDHGPAARRAVRSAGFDVGAGTHPAPVTRLSDRFELPRLWVDDEEPDRLERRLLRLVSS